MLTSTDEIRAGDINTLDFLRFFRAENTGTTSLVRYAGFWWRALALTIDTVLIVIAFVIVMLVVYFRWLDAPWTAGLNGLIQITLFIVGWLYWTMFESSWMQATPGKKICRLRVTDLSGKRISFGRANGRYFAKTLSAVVYLIGYSVAAVTRRKQAWHDMLADCLVLRTQSDYGPYDVPAPLPKAPWWRWALSLPLALLVTITGLLVLIFLCAP